MPWGVVYYKDPGGNVPAEDFLDACPTKVETTILAVLEAVRAAPPPQFSGGGKWEAMRGTMGGLLRDPGYGPRSDALSVVLPPRQWDRGRAGRTRLRSAADRRDQRPL